MIAHALSFHLVGLDAQPIHVEADVVAGAPHLAVLGVAEPIAREIRVRTRAALLQVGVDLGNLDVTVNLSPSHLKKMGGVFDLAVACAVLAAMGEIEPAAIEAVALLGELSLTGALRPVRGVLPLLRAAGALGIRRAVVPRDNAVEASAMEGIQIGVAGHLKEVLHHLKTGAPLDGAPVARVYAPAFGPIAVDLSDVRGQAVGRRAVEIAAAGGHGLLVVGADGAGQTMLARRLATVLPGMTRDEALEVTAIHSVAGLIKPDDGVLTARPYRAPHHTVSAVGLAGGGDPVRPGEVSLAHHGVLFLDRLTEFRGAVLESIRSPLEDGSAVHCRAGQRAVYPARPLLVASAASCPCGEAGTPAGGCTCTPDRLKRHRARISGPIYDRMEVQAALAASSPATLAMQPRGERSEVVRARVVAARAAQTERARQLGLPDVNAALTSRGLEQVALPDDAGARILAAAVERLGLPARAYGAVLRVARTIADLDGSDAVRAAHVAEAVHARLLDRPVA